VRLRTRARRARDAVRRVFPRRLPSWSVPGPVRAGAGAGQQVEIVVETAGALRRVVEDRAARLVRVVVTDWRAPHPGWTGRLGPLPGAVNQQVTVPARGRGRATVTVGLASPLPVARVVAAVHPVLEPLRSPVPTSPTVGAGVSAGGPVVETVGPVVSAGAANPRGRQRYGPGLPIGELVLDGGRWEIARIPDGTTVVAGRSGEPLDERQRAVLAELGLVTCPPTPRARRSRSNPARFAGIQPEQLIDQRDLGVVVQMAMTGVVLHAPDCPRIGVQSKGGRTTTATRLADELAGILRGPLPGDDPVEWEIRSVRQRRAAMRHHAGLAPVPVSAVLVSKRPGLVAGQVAVLAGQTYPDLEIVVGLHGFAEPAGLVAAAGDRPLRTILVPAGHNLGQALQEVTGAASGTLITKVDDDDRYGPEHVWDLVLAHHFSGATVVGKGADFVYLEPEETTVRRRMAGELFTDTVAGGTITLARDDLAAAGGWPPLPRHVDRALLDRVLDGGGLVYRTHPLGFIYTRHGESHTWQADPDYFHHDAQRRWQGLPPYQEFGTV
jgi:hypothetical protein